MKTSWDTIQHNPAKVMVLHMTPVRWDVGEGRNTWARVPDRLAGLGTRVFSPTGPVDGVADYQVTRAGYLLVACHFGYQGNSSGGWLSERWTRSEFYRHGWREATKEDLGGTLVKGGNREQVVFVKKVAAGERGRLRCNKYDPPYFIVCVPGPDR